jgi:acyl-CoA synthetase (AMP-forming)/AMP-acid ligase II
MPGMQLPPFHALGFVLQVLLPLFSGVAIVLFPPVVKSPDVIPMAATAENTLQHMQRTKCNALVSVPAFLQAWAKDTHAINILRGLELVVRLSRLLFVVFGFLR